MQNLVAQFGRAGLDLRELRAPLAGAVTNIFQMDIRRERASEMFRLWRGRETNRVEVTAVDRGRSQLVLLVKEAASWFEERMSKRSSRTPPKVGPNRILVRENSYEWVFQRQVSGSERRFLCGMDERHLFIAQFTRGSDVRAAHKALKPEEVRDAERSGCGPALRQGEWFFVRPTRTEQANLEREVSKRPYVVRERASLGGNGLPHVADEVVVDGRRVFARGSVRHPDHKTLRLDSWRRVFRNAEILESTVGSNGIYWVD